MKVLANRLKPLMPKLTSSCHSSFVEGRQAADNIIILQEIVHTLRKQKGRRGAIVAKIDLEKAYEDRMGISLAGIVNSGFFLTYNKTHHVLYYFR